MGTVASVIVAVLGVIALFAANVLIWADSTLLSTQGFVPAVSRALDEPDSQERIADVVAQRVVESPEFQRQMDAVSDTLARELNQSPNVPPAIQEQLPTNFDFLARAAEPQIQRLIETITLRILESEFSGAFRDTVLRTLHSNVIAVLEDRSVTGVGVEDDQVVLDLRGVIDRVFERIGIATPARLQNDPSFGQVVLVEDAGALQQASFFVKNRVEIAMGALLIAALLFGAAIFLSPDHRGGVLTCGYAIAGAGILTLLLLWGGDLWLQSSSDERTVLKNMVDSLASNLRLQSIALIVLGGCLIAVGDRRILRVLEGGWSQGAAAVERFGVARTALIVLGGAAFLLVVL